MPRPFHGPSQGVLSDGGKRLFHNADFRRSEKANTSIAVNAIMLNPGRQRDSHTSILVEVETDRKSQVRCRNFR
jgi:hypothetical protein